MKYLIFVMYILSSAFGMVFIKYAGKDLEFKNVSGVFSFHFNLFFVIGLLLYIISFPLWIMILQKFQLTFISPIAYGIFFIFLSILSSFILKEVVSINKIIGFILIILGVFVSSFKIKI